MPENIPQIRAYNKFLEFRNHYLLLMKRKYGLRDEDSEDIFQDALLIGIRKFNSDRGEFENFFYTIYENKIKNFLGRENLKKVLLSLDEYDHADELKADIEAERSFLLYFNSMEHFSNSLKRRLGEEEKQFYEELKNVIMENSNGFISTTARNLGMEPSKGWDVWRKIQRKIKSLLEEKKAELHKKVLRLEVDSHISFLEFPDFRRGLLTDHIDVPQFEHLEDLSPEEVNLLLSFFE